MSRADIHLVGETGEIESQFRSVMRRLAGGVAIVPAGRGDDITGMTVTSLTSLGADPPRLLVSINRHAPSFGLIERHRLFGVSILGSDQQALADRFSSARLKGRQGFEGAAWSAGQSGVPLLTESLAIIECQAEEIMERYSHGIIVDACSHGLSSSPAWSTGTANMSRSIATPISTGSPRSAFRWRMFAENDGDQQHEARDTSEFRGHRRRPCRHRANALEARPDRC